MRSPSRTQPCSFDHSHNHLCTHTATEGLKPLMGTVRGPQQAQQAWELVSLLAARPLPPRAAGLLARRAVDLIVVS